MKKTVLLLCGGKSDEHEISLISAKCILDSIDRSQFQPVLVGISRNGEWYLEEEDTFFTGEFRADQIKLNTKAPKVKIAPFLNEGRGRLDADGKQIAFDVVFPILHGPFGEDGTMQGLLEIIGVPYVGSNCGSSWICMDKALAKTLASSQNIRSADYEIVTDLQELDDKAKSIAKLGFPLFVKPSRLGSSVGVAKVSVLSELRPAVEAALKFDSKILIERGIKGREIECAVLGLNRTARAALPGEIIPSPKVGWYSYEAKYLMSDGAAVVVPAQLTPETIKAVQEFALKVFRLFECDGLARVDLFLENDTNTIYLNEVNTIPGFTPISMYPKMWQASGLSYSALITELIHLAFERSRK